MSSQTFASIAAMIVILVGVVGLLGNSAPSDYQLAQVVSQNQETAQVENVDTDSDPDNLSEMNQGEVDNILSYIGDNLKNYGDLLKRLNKVKLPGIEPYRAVVSEMLAQIKETRSVLTNAASDDAKSNAINSYNMISWPEIEEADAAVNLAEQLPKVIKFIPSFPKLMNTFNKSPQLAGLIGLDIAQLQQTINNQVTMINQLQSLVASGNLPEAVNIVREQQQGTGGIMGVESLSYQVKDLVSAAQRLNRLKKFPEVAEQVRQILMPAWADFYDDPGGVGSLHQGDEGNDGKTLTDEIWATLDEAEMRAQQKKGRRAARFNKYGYLAQAGESLGVVTVAPQSSPTPVVQQLSPQPAPVPVPPPPTPAPPPPLPVPTMPENDRDDDRDNQIDYQQIKDVIRQIKRDLLREVKQLVKQATKAGMQTEVAQLNGIMNALNNTLAILSNPAASNSDLRDTMENFHEARHWDTVNEIRAKVELPKQIKDMERQIRSITKLINSKSTKKALSVFGLDMTSVNNNLAETTQLLQEVKNSLQNGDAEGAQEGMRGVWENNPGDAEGIIHQLRGFADMMRGIRKNADLIAQLKALAQPGVDAFNAGDYQEARELLEAARNDAQDVLNSVMRRSSW